LKNEILLKNILQKLPAEQQELFNLGIDNNFDLGHYYHFQDFEHLSGTLVTIGLAPQNDSHIFCVLIKVILEM
jgi:hypothetical protein